MSAKNSAAVAGLIVSTAFLATGAIFNIAQAEPLRLAQAHVNAAEKSAFESARELGSVEAWDAFLSHYPSGFHADLARAYVKKLSEGASAPAAAAAPAVPTVAVAATTIATGSTHEIGCKEQQKARSRNSKAAAKITFVNKSGMHRAILWLDFKGNPKDYASLDHGQQVTLDTYLTHPWMITDGPGNCIHIFMPGSGSTKVNLGKADVHAADTGEEEDLEATRAATKKRAAKRAAERSRAKRAAKKAAARKAKRKKKTKTAKKSITCPAGKVWNGKSCAQSVYLDKKGLPQDGYYTDSKGNVYQDNGGGE